MDSELKKLRGFEKLLYYISNYGDALVLATTILDTGDDLASETVFSSLNEGLSVKALEYLRRRHPLLNIKLVKVANDVCLSLDNDSAKLEYRYGLKEPAFGSRKTLVAQLEQFNQKRFNYDDEKQLLWRTRLDSFVDEEDDARRTRLALTLIIPLFLTDGINIVAVLAELVNILNALLANKECDEMNHKLDVLDNFYDVCLKSNLVNDTKMEKIKQRIRELPPPNKYILDPKLKSEDGVSGLKICIFRLDALASKRLIAESKAHKAKLTGVLYAICLYALRDLYAEKGLEFPRSLLIGLPANLRLRVDPPLHFSSVRHYINLFKFKLDLPSTGGLSDLWKDSIEINKHVEACVNVEDGSFFTASHDQRGFDEFFSAVEDPSSSAEEAHQRCASMNDSDFMISNTGTYVYEQFKKTSAVLGGPLLMKEVYFGDSLSSCPRVSGALIVHTSSWNQELMFQISANKSAIDAELVDRYVELVKSRINQCI